MSTILKKIFLLGFIAVTVSSCASMNKDECVTANWKNIGYGDGAKGQKVTRLSQHTSACAKHGVTPNLAQYNAGRSEGLKQYCTPSTGYNLGVSGKQYNGVCSNHGESQFKDAIAYGLTVNSAQQKVNALRNEYSNQQNHISNLKRKIKRSKKRLLQGKLTELQAYKLIEKNGKMAVELDRAISGLAPLEGEIADQEQHVSQLKSQSGFN